MFKKLGFDVGIVEFLESLLGYRDPWIGDRNLYKRGISDMLNDIENIRTNKD